jgi:hypothetical protein
MKFPLDRSPEARGLLKQLDLVLSLQSMGLLGPCATLAQCAGALGITTEYARQRIVRGRRLLDALAELQDKGLDASIDCLRWFDANGVRAVHVLVLKQISTLDELAQSPSPQGISGYFAHCGKKTERVLMRWWSAVEEFKNGATRE